MAKTIYKLLIPESNNTIGESKKVRFKINIKISQYQGIR